MSHYDGVDFYEMDRLLTDEERMVRDTVRRMVDQEILPTVAEHYRQGTFPTQMIPRFGELGLLGASVNGYGCAGMGPVAYGLALQELERADSGVRSFVSVQGALVMHAVYAYGSEAHKDRWLPGLRDGTKIGCFGLTEPDFGSNPGGMRTRAVQNGDRYVLNGSKAWITNATIADLAVVWARMDDGEIGGFLVERGTKGFRTQVHQGKQSMRASDTGELIFEDCEIPGENRLPKAQGLKSALGCLNQARYGIAWGVLGAAMACYDEALEYAKTRVQFERPIAGYQLVQNKLVHMLSEITKGQLLALQLGRLKESGVATHVHVSLAKRNNVAAALEIARLARDILGANGITDEYQTIRHMCNLETVYTYEGTHDIHTLIVGEHITGISAFS